MSRRPNLRPFRVSFFDPSVLFVLLSFVPSSTYALEGTPQLNTSPAFAPRRKKGRKSCGMKGILYGRKERHEILFSSEPKTKQLFTALAENHADRFHFQPLLWEKKMTFFTRSRSWFVSMLFLSVVLQCCVKSNRDTKEKPHLSLKSTPSSVSRSSSSSKKGSLIFNSKIDGIKILVNGVYRSFFKKAGVSQTLSLDVGQYRFTFRKDGYEDKAEDVLLEEGSELPIEITLLPFTEKKTPPATISTPTVATKLPNLSGAPIVMNDAEKKTETTGFQNKTPLQKQHHLNLPPLAQEKPRNLPPVQPLPPSNSSQKTNPLKNEGSPAIGSRKSFSLEKVSFAVRYISAGSFTKTTALQSRFRFGVTKRSSPELEKSSLVEIKQGFWMMETEVTQSLFREVMKKNPSHFQECGGLCPVENISWNVAAKFANELSARQKLEKCFSCQGETRDSWICEGIFVYDQCKGWKMPTSAEWEYAARAGTTSPFHTGACISTEQANYNGNYPFPNCPEGEHRKRTIPVASLRSNAWGLFDMHGNVWEWVYDTHSRLSHIKIIRGGGWDNKAIQLQNSGQYTYPKNFKSEKLGFRLIFQ